MLDYGQVTPLDWIQASELSRSGRYAYEPVPDSLVLLFRAIAVERSSTPAQQVDDASWALGAARVLPVGGYRLEVPAPER